MIINSTPMSKYLSYETLTETCNKIAVEHLDAINAAMVGAKILACAFILMYWIKSYAEGVKDPKKGKGISFHNIGVGIVYIALVLNFNVISDALDTGLGAYEQSFNTEISNNIYNFTEGWMEEYAEAEILEEENQGVFGTIWDTTVGIYSAVASALSINIWHIIYEIIKGIAWFINAIIFPIFVLERGFLLMLLKIVMPLILALGAIEKYRALVWKWVSLYIAVFLTGLFLILATQFCDSAFGMIVQGCGLESEPDSKTILFMVIVFLKVKLYKSSFEFAYRIFNA